MDEPLTTLLHKIKTVNNTVDKPFTETNQQDFYIRPLLSSKCTLIKKSDSNFFDEYQKEPDNPTESLGGINSPGSMNSTICKIKHKIIQTIRIMKKVYKPANRKVEFDHYMDSLISRLISLDSPKVLKIFEYFSDESSYTIVTEYYDCSRYYNLHQSLFLKYNFFDEKTCCYIMYQLLQAINDCQKKQIYHSHIKLEDIIIDMEEYSKHRLKLINFMTPVIINSKDNSYISLAELLELDDNVNMYSAPELIFKKEKNSFTEKCEVWSCGVILYMLLSKQKLLDEKKLLKSLHKLEINIKFLFASKQVKDLIGKLLRKNPNERISIQEALKHEWFKKNKVESYFLGIKTLLISNRKEIYNIFLLNFYNYKINAIQDAIINFVDCFLSSLDRKLDKPYNFYYQITNQLDEKVTCDKLKNIFIEKLNLTDKEHKAALEKKVEEAFEAYDVEEKGYLRFEEFLKTIRDKDELFKKEENIVYAFRYFSKGKDDINKGDIDHLIEKNKKERVIEINKILDYYNGKLTFQNFRKEALKENRKGKI